MGRDRESAIMENSLDAVIVHIRMDGN